MFRQLIFTFIISFFMVSTAVASEAWSEGDYVLYEGDYNNDGVQDFVLYPHKFILISGGVNVPFFIDSGAEAIVLLGNRNGSYSYASPVDIDILKEMWRSSKLSLSDYKVLYGDLDNDTLADIVLQPASDFLNLHIIKSSDKTVASFYFSDLGYNSIGSNTVTMTISSGTPGSLVTQSTFGQASFEPDFKKALTDSSQTQSPSVFGLINSRAWIDTSGAARYEIPLSLPSGINGLQPSLSLNYNSYSGNSSLGLGWSMSGHPAIQRCSANKAEDNIIQGITLTDADKFCLNGQKLIAINGGNDKQYKTQIDEFEKIFSHGGLTDNPDYWEVITKSGERYFYGQTQDSKLTSNALGSPKTLIWSVNSRQDVAENTINYSYESFADRGIQRPESISYAGTTIEFIYNGRPDSTTQYYAGQIVTKDKYLTRVVVTNSAASKLSYSYKLNYEQSQGTDRSLLSDVSMCETSGCVSPLSFNYQDEALSSLSNLTPSSISNLGQYNGTVASDKPEFLSLDANADGYSDIIKIRKTGTTRSAALYLNNKVGGYTHSQDFNPNNTDTGYYVFDVNGDGLEDFAEIKKSANDSTSLFTAWLSDGKGKLVKQTDSNSFGNNSTGEENGKRYQIMDMNGDALPDLVKTYKTGSTAYAQACENNGDGTIGTCTTTNLGSWNQIGATLTSTIMPMDTNGDGQQDLVAIYRSGENAYANIWSNNGTLGFIPELSALALGVWNSNLNQTPGFLSFDVNADGISDIVKIKESNGKTYSESWLNTETNTFTIGVTEQIASTWVSPISNSPSYFYPIDINFDGSKDLVHIYKLGSYSYSVSLINDDRGGFYEANRKQLSQNYTSDSLGRNYLTMDVNADGSADLVEISQASSAITANANVISWIVSGSPYQDKLVQVDNLYGTANKFNYGLSSDRNLYRFDDSNWPTNTTDKINQSFASHPLASSIESDNGLGGFDTVAYRYYGKKSQTQGLGNLGYAKVQKFDISNETVKVLHYSQAWQGRLNGSLDKLEICSLASGFNLSSYTGNDYCGDNASGLLERETYAWESRYISGEASKQSSCTVGNCSEANPGSLSYSIIKTKSLFESYGTKQELIQAKSLEYTYDSYANITRLVTRSGTSVSGMTVGSVDAIETDDYDYDLSQNGVWLINKSIRKVSGGSLVPTSNTTAFEYTQIGLLSRKTTEPNTELEVNILYSNFEKGLPKTVTTSWSSNEANSSLPKTQAQMRYQYDANGAISESINILDHQESYQEHPVYSVLESYTNANGQSTNITVDLLGRTLFVDGPQFDTSIEYGICSNGCEANASSYVFKTTTEQPSERSYFDSLGRTIKNSVQVMGGNWSHTLASYNAKGQLKTASEPFFTGAPTYATKYSYDAKGRTTDIHKPGNRSTSIEFTGLTQAKIEHFDGKSQKTITKANAFGLVESGVDNNDSSLEYQYNGRGQLKKTIDMDRNEITIYYDINGARTQLIDPDKGTWTYLNNVYGQVTKEINANGDVTEFEYDLLGRLVKRTNSEGVSSWEYDQATNAQGIPNSIGQLNQAAQGGYIEDYSYDGFGNLAKKSVDFGDGNKADVSWHYIKGKLDTQTYPGGYTVKQTYDSTGYLKTVHRKDDANDIHWQATGMDARGNLTAYELDGGLKTFKKYDAATGFIKSIDSLWGGVAHAQISTYEFDGMGNLTSRNDHLNMSSAVATATQNPELKQDFTYDALNRLETWTTRSFDGIGTSGQLKKMSYYSNGNIKTKADVGTYIYQQQGSCTLPSGPHAVSYIQGKGQFCYDASGNMLTGDGKTFTYTSFDKPKTIVKGAAKTKFSYGPSLGRYKRTDTVTSETGSGVQNTWYLDGIYEKVEDKNGKIIERFFLGDFGLIERTESAVAGSYLEQTRYFLKDHIGSVLAVVEGGSMRLLQQFHYDVWGKREYVKTADYGVNPWDSFGLSGRLGFTGHEMLDTVGLIHMNGRVYDPELARFVSADPIIQDSYNTQSFNRYSYVWNNPLSFTDPSGFRRVDPEYGDNDERETLSNNESDPRFGRDSDDHNNRRVREENRAAERERQRVAAEAAKQKKAAEEAAARAEKMRARRDEEALINRYKNKALDEVNKKFKKSINMGVNPKPNVKDLSLNISARAGYGPAVEVQVNIGFQRTGAYVGTGVGYGADVALEVANSTNLASNAEQNYPQGLTTHVTQSASVGLAHASSTTTISEGGVDHTISSGVGLGSFTGQTSGYTGNLEY